VLGVFLAGQLCAQVDLLTLREVEMIVARVPEVSRARKAGSCPQLSSTFSGVEGLDFQVRLNCGPNSGELLNNYTISRRTGAIRLSGPAGNIGNTLIRGHR
jgi:hypothetical protein